MEAPFNEIERIEREYERKGKRYADWQKEKYPVHVDNYEKRIGEGEYAKGRQVKDIPGYGYKRIY